MIKVRLWWVLYLVTLISFTPPLHSYHPDIKFKNISISEGLSQSTIFCIYQDSQGYMWFGTMFGLNRYDGYQFTVFDNDPMIPSSLSCNFVRDIGEDTEKNLLVGTDEGLNILNRNSGEFTCLRHNPDDPSTITHDDVTVIYTTRKGEVWIGTRKGLNRFDPQTGKFTRFLHQPQNPQSLACDLILCIYEDRSDNLWIGNGEGVDRFDPRTKKFVHLPLASKDGVGLTGKVVLSMMEDRDGFLWICTRQGLNQYDPKSGNFKFYTRESGNSETLSHPIINCIQEDSHGNLWVGTPWGLNHMKKGSGKFTQFFNHPKNPDSLSNNTINCLFRDHSDSIWVGTFGGGLNLIRPIQFQKRQMNPDSSNTLSCNDITSFAEDDEGNIWLGTRGGGLNKWNPKQDKFSVFLGDREKKYKLRSNTIHCLHKSNRLPNTLWLGTGKGLHRLDIQDEKFHRMKRDDNLPDNPIAKSIFTIFEDKDGILWLGTPGKGLLTFNQKTLQYSKIKFKSKEGERLSKAGIAIIRKDPQGIMWIGTTTDGLFKFNPESGELHQYKTNPRNPHSLRHNTVLAIYWDSQKKLWIGTGGGGLNLLNPQSERFTHFMKKDGLGDNVVYGILEDSQKCLWISGNRGLSRFCQERKDFKIFGPDEGLQSWEFNQGAYFVDSAGQMFFGGVNGVNFFTPKEIQGNSTVPPLVFTSIRSLTQKPHAEKYRSGLDKLKFSYQDSFLISFAALSYQAPEKNRYAYRIKGLQEEWIQLGNRHEITFANLKPGRYTLEVKGSNNDGIWNQQGIRMKLSVHPPFWRTWWFGALLLLIAGLSFYQWHKSRLQRQAQRLQSEAAMARFFAKCNISEREQEVLRLMLNGRSYHEISDSLYISYHTVKNHIYKIYQKLNIKNRGELITLFKESSLISPDQLKKSP